MLYVYSCKNKHIFPNFQTFSGKYANLRVSFNRCVIRPVFGQEKKQV